MEKQMTRKFTHEKKKKHQSHPFKVGKHYHNRHGEYCVVSINEPDMVIRYPNGSTIESPIALQARIWENMQEEDGNDLGLKL